MKKFLFILYSALMPSFLISTHIFKKNFYEIIANDFLRNYSEKNNSLVFLKYIAKEYLDQGIEEQDIFNYFSFGSGEPFSLDYEEEDSIIKSFASILQKWQDKFEITLYDIFVNKTASDELKNFIEPSYYIKVAVLFDTKQLKPEDVISFLSKEEKKNFINALITICNRKPFIERNKVILGMGTLSAVGSGVVALKSFLKTKEEITMIVNATMPGSINTGNVAHFSAITVCTLNGFIEKGIIGAISGGIIGAVGGDIAGTIVKSLMGNYAYDQTIAPETINNQITD